MDPLLGFIGLGVSLIALNGLVILWQRRQRLARWRLAARGCGLTKITEEKTGPQETTELAARFGPLRVRFAWYEHLQEKGSHVLVEARWPTTLKGFTLHPELSGLSEEQKLREIVTGDARFDDAFLIGGPSPAVRALLDAEMRTALLELHEHGRLMIARDEVRLEVRSADPGRLSAAVRVQLDVAERLTRSLVVGHALGANARKDPDPFVRLACLVALARECKGQPDTRRTLRAALEDPHPEVRLRAALALGAGGRSTLREIAESLADDSCAAEAIAALGPDLDAAATVALLDRALAARRREAARACLSVLGRHGSAALTALIRALAHEDDLAEAAAHALGATGLDAAQPPLVEALDRDHDALRRAAAEALAQVGTAEAVLPLKEAAARHARDKAFQRAVRQAVAQIQERLTGATPGQVSLADGGSGRVSIASEASGGVSLRNGDE